MTKIIIKLDISLADYVYSKIKNKKLDRILARINTGELMIVLLIPYMYYVHDWDFWKPLVHVSIVAFFTDLLILFIKKTTSRNRPFIGIMGHKGEHPDMKHSFPSAHAANSMVAVTMLILGYDYSGFFFILTFLAGIGRLITLHHYLSDVLGGWAIGFFMGILGIMIKYYMN